MSYLCILFSAPDDPKNCELENCKFHNKLPNGFECPIQELTSDSRILRSKITALTKKLNNFIDPNAKK